MFRSRTFLKNARKGSSLAAIGLSALLLVSCGGDDDEDTTPTAAPATQPPAATDVVTEEATEAVVATTETGDTASPAAEGATPVASPGAVPVTGMAESIPIVASTPIAGASTPACWEASTTSSMRSRSRPTSPTATVRVMSEW